ncbi:hypothetical protein E2C01_074872 [Portunus trituberculatus]|uniref:Uncharacterized protein n=1 Tax=Portunus trituberculatus TaxID=210409 RepID=A0A5B7IDJ1_PORTR|nr:hypothetical protein [Portunus trituberculatus]
MEVLATCGHIPDSPPDPFPKPHSKPSASPWGSLGPAVINPLLWQCTSLTWLHFPLLSPLSASRQASITLTDCRIAPTERSVAILVTSRASCGHHTSAARDPPK